MTIHQYIDVDASGAIYDGMTAATRTPFWRMHGLGNQILVVDERATGVRLGSEAARDLGSAPDLGFDQLMSIRDAGVAGVDAEIAIFNRDGSTAGACGNGMRCVGLVAREILGGDRFLFLVGGQLLRVSVDTAERVVVNMGRPRFDWHDIPLAEPFADTRYIELQIGPIDNPLLHSPSVVNVGNPHAVFWVDDLHAYDLAAIGPMLENHPIFPERANISLAQIVSRSHVRVRTWERGAGLTQACGSAACAVAVCAARTRRLDRSATVSLPGGDLSIMWRDDDTIEMAGPASHLFAGHLTVGPGTAVRV
ncbi:MAG: diaminopimelate epimerase [Hyphomicrobiaceae bacterium]